MRFLSFSFALLFVTLAFAGSFSGISRASKRGESVGDSPSPASHMLQSRTAGFWPGYTSTTAGPITCDWWNWFLPLIFGGPAEQTILSTCSNAYQASTGYFFFGLANGFVPGNPEIRTCTQAVPQGAKILAPISNGAWWEQDCW